ncbi:hypothetical protein ARMGADRAFT_873316, partial [Armillaria gallica]
GLFQAHNPPMYKAYCDNQETLHASNHLLQKNFNNSVFEATTVNFGNACTDELTDNGNRADGWCVITAIRNFDQKTGGHLILWDLRLIVEFPAGSSIFIPSALITHSNISVAPDEVRFSMTQYTAGRLFRWVYNSFRS